MLAPVISDAAQVGTDVAFGSVGASVWNLLLVPLFLPSLLVSSFAISQSLEFSPLIHNNKDRLQS